MQEFLSYFALLLAVAYLIKKFFFTKNKSGCANCPKITDKKL